MHSGGANTILRNNRKLLKKRSSRFKSKRTIMGLKDKDIRRDESENKKLTTWSASEIKRVGRKLRRRRRVETAIVLLLIFAALLFIFSSFGSYHKPESHATPVTAKQFSKNQTDLEEVSEDPYVQSKDVKAEQYMIFGREFFYSGQYRRALKMFEKALALSPKHCLAPAWIDNTNEQLDALRVQNLKKLGETRYESMYENR